MRLPAALEQWAAEHNEQLSGDTLSEVRMIASTLDDSPLSTRLITDPDDGLVDELATLFQPSRAERAATLIQIVADWSAKPAPPIAETPAPRAPLDATTPGTPGPQFAPAADRQPAGQPRPASGNDPIHAPALFGSDRVDEEDHGRLYGPKRPWKAIAATLVSLALLGGVAAAGWYWFTQRDSTTETATSQAQATPLPESDDGSAGADDPGPSAETVAPTPEPTLEPDPASLPPAFWADTTPILNSGTEAIVASTYAVSPSNRAVLTGHTAAITGVAISNDGRVLTSGADRRLVDWGADVTLANPDVFNVPAPLTVLERTRDQRLIAGDTDGNVTILSLTGETDPSVLPIHDVAVSAAAELTGGRLAVASVDGAVAVFDIETPDEQVSLPHAVEVTAVVALADGTVATAAVDGIVRIWVADGQDTPPESVADLGSPVTALTLLSDGRLAAATVDGAIQLFAADASAPPVELPGHTGAVRSLFELSLPDDSVALASGGDDTTIMLWNLDTRTADRVLEGHGDIISGLDVLPDGRLVSTSGDGTGRVWDLTVDPGRSVLAPHDWNLSAIHAWNNDQFVTGGVDGKVVLASTSETSEPVLVTQHGAPVVGVSVLESGDIVSLDAASELRINQAGDTSGTPSELSIAAGATALAANDVLGVVSGHADGTVRLYDVAAETPETAQIAVVEAHGGGVNDVVALSNGMVASAGQDDTVRIIDFENPGVLPVFDLHTGPVDVVIELPDGRIASAGADGIYVYSVEGLAQDHVRFNGQRSRTISLVGLSGDRLISTGEDGRVRLWDLTAPEAEPTTLIDIPGVVNPYLAQADNGLFVAGAARGYVVFDVSE